MRIIGTRLLIVTAHPDDESFLAAGTMLKNHAGGGKNFVFCATLGERGRSHFKNPVTDTELKRIRLRELRAVSRVLHVLKLCIGKLPDGAVATPVNLKRFRTALQKFAERVHPDIVIGFGRDGISGHKDHVAAGRIAEALARKLKLPYLAFCMPPETQANHAALARRRRHGVYVKNHRPLESPDIVFAVHGARKLAVLRMHKSQLERNDPFWNLPRSMARAYLRAEHFAIRDRRIRGAHR